MSANRRSTAPALAPAALYLRLSSADGPDAESDSIQNQRAFLHAWAQARGFAVIAEFVDDGHTGTDFDRPGFQALTARLLDGSVRCVIVKDLSRLGRNYAETGRYLEQVFPRLGVRFIAVNDQYDSARNSDGAQQMAVFKNVFNDFYAADASAKVRASLNILKRQGKFLARLPPYGYRIDLADKYHLLPDEETAPVVRQVFGLFLGGASRTAIARRLNETQVPPPALQKQMKDKSRRFSGLWNAEAIRRILSHPVYQGDMAQQFTRTVSYKVHDRRRVDPQDWIVVPNTHVPLVSRADFALAQRMLQVRGSAVTGHPHLLTGIAFCADCGSPLYAKKRGEYWYLNCYGYYRAPTLHRCTAHSMREDQALQAVLETLRGLIRQCISPETLVSACGQSGRAEDDPSVRRQRLEQRLATARRARLNAYKDQAAGKLSAEEFAYIAAELEREEANCRETLAVLCAAPPPDPARSAGTRVRRFLRLESLEKSQLQTLVRRVEVDARKHITVTFAFTDPRREGGRNSRRTPQQPAR